MSSVFEGKSITKTILKIGLLIIMSIACVFGMGGSSVIARQLGEGNKDYSAKCLNFCIYSIAIAGPLTLALGLLVLTPFSYVIGADDGNLGYTRDYLKWIFMGAPFVMLANSSFFAPYNYCFAKCGVVYSRGNHIKLLLAIGRRYTDAACC